MGDLFYTFACKTIGRAFRARSVEGIGNVVRTEPAVFIANHCGSKGPEAVLSSLPFRLHTWVLDRTVNFRDAPEYLRKDFVEKELRLRPPFSRILSFLIALIAVPFLKALNTIPVYTNSRLLEERTFRISLDLLMRRKDLLIFPEYPDSLFPQPIHPFQTGFTRLGELYFQKTGRALNFYPVAFHAGLKRIVIGKPIPYQSDRPFREERRRLSGCLENEIRSTYRDLEAHLPSRHQ